MAYSTAYSRLYEISLDIDLKETLHHERIAGYLTIVREMPHPKLLPSEWMKRFDEHKDTALRHFVKLTDYEWEVIREAMEIYANKSSLVKWKTKRKNWVVALDTLRAFS